MGMFDEFHFLGDAAKLVVCAAGHDQRGSLQTKDLDNTMQHFEVFGPDEEGFFGAYETMREPPRYSLEGRHLITRTSSKLVSSLHGGVSVHTSCCECEPVFYEDHRGFRGDVSGMSPWCQWILVFDNGRLNHVVQDRCETRESTRKKLIELGSMPIPDSDRVVQRELELWRAGTKSPLF